MRDVAHRRRSRSVRRHRAPRPILTEGAGPVGAEPGPGPVARAAVGILLGAACGAFALTVLPRRPSPPSPNHDTATEVR